MQEFKVFPRFQDLFVRSGRFDESGVQTTKKWQEKLEKDAIEWFKESFNNVTIGPTGTLRTPKYYYQGTLIFDIEPMGGYHYSYLIKWLHFREWKPLEWVQGRKYGLATLAEKDSSGRDGNPYAEADFYRNMAWDCGYMYGLTRKR